MAVTHATHSKDPEPAAAAKAAERASAKAAEAAARLEAEALARDLASPPGGAAPVTPLDEMAARPSLTQIPMYISCCNNKSVPS